MCLFQTGDLFTITLINSEMYIILFRLELKKVEN